MNLQKTIIRPIQFSGVGLHTGLIANVTIKSAPENFGIQFCRTDINPSLFIPAKSSNVSNTNRSTTIKKHDSEVITVEHLLSAFYALEMENTLKLGNYKCLLHSTAPNPYGRRKQKTSATLGMKNRWEAPLSHMAQLNLR